MSRLFNYEYNNTYASLHQIRRQQTIAAQPVMRV